MAATVQIREIISANAAGFQRDPSLAMDAALTSINKSAGTLRFRTNLSTAVDAANPIPIPASGTNYSWEKCVVFYLGSINGPEVNIDNLRFYTDGTNSWTGVSLYVSSGAGPVGFEPGWTADLAASTAAQYTALLGTDSAAGRAVVDAFNYTAAAPLALQGAGAGNGDDGVANVFTAAFDGMHVGNLLLMQMDVASTATAGTLAAETMTFAFDEN